MRKKAPDRNTLVASTVRDVNALVLLAERSAKRHFQLVMLMESTGYICNRPRATARELGDAIIALTRVLEGDWLVSTAHSATFYLQLDPRKRISGNFERAERLADLTLLRGGVDVDKRNARIRLEEQQARKLEKQATV